MLLDLLLAACLGAKTPDEAPAAVSVHCAPVSVGTVTDTLVLKGPLRPPPDRDALVVAQVPGLVTELPVREGDTLATGDVVAVLDGRTLHDAVVAAQATAAAAHARATQLKAEADRKAELLTRGIVSQSDSAVAQADASDALADATVADAALLTARTELTRTRLRSPIDGVLLHLGVRLGETVDPSSNTPLAEIVDPSIIELVGQVPVADITRLKRGQAASISAGGSAPLPATVLAVPPGVDAATGLGTVRVRLAKGERLPVGAIGVATVQIGQRTGVLTVPETAIRGAAQGGQEVVACVDGHAKAIAVIPGATHNHQVEVRATGSNTLESTTQVVVQGSLALQDGAVLAARP